MNRFGNGKFNVTIFGESHGAAVGVVIDGIPAGIRLSVNDFEADIERRKAGAKGTTPRTEADQPQILSGLHEGHTTGSPMAILFANNNTHGGDYASVADHPRPGHADWVAMQKYQGHSDLRGGGHLSGRLTLPLVAAGVVAKKMLNGMEFSSRLTEIGGEEDSTKWPDILTAAEADGDSVGGIVECCVKHPSVGLGEPFFDSVESIISHALFSIPGVRGVEFGDGFGAARKRGSEHNDAIVAADGTTATNGAGGINGGIANGNDIVVRVAFKPTSSIRRTQQSLSLASGKVEALSTVGRHDVCIALRGEVVVEAAVAIALATLAV